MIKKIQLLDNASPAIKELVAQAYDDGLAQGRTQAPMFNWRGRRPSLPSFGLSNTAMELIASGLTVAASGVGLRIFYLAFGDDGMLAAIALIFSLIGFAISTLVVYVVFFLGMFDGGQK